MFPALYRQAFRFLKTRWFVADTQATSPMMPPERRIAAHNR